MHRATSATISRIDRFIRITSKSPCDREGAKSAKAREEDAELILTFLRVLFASFAPSRSRLHLPTRLACPAGGGLVPCQTAGRGPALKRTARRATGEPGQLKPPSPSVRRLYGQIRAD